MPRWARIPSVSIPDSTITGSGRRRYRLVDSSGPQRTRRLLESLGMVLVDELDEHGARQCVYTPGGDQDDSDLR